MNNPQQLEEILEISFEDKKLLREALTHRSYLNEHQEEKLSSNERLEFLGDAVLEFVVSRLLFEYFPTSPEGFLTACRSQIVQTKTLSQLAKKLSLGQFLLLSKGEEEGGGRENLGLLENAFEAIVGAIYIDQGVQRVEDFLKKYFTSLIENLSPEDLKDAKSLLQEKTQEREKITPSYRLIKQEGPDHAKIFTVGVFLQKRKLSDGQGRSKQEAEEAAAQKALEKYY
ncbi:MAG: ribonuclease III [bacterium]|nr:ribonuclease III [bacterium]